MLCENLGINPAGHLTFAGQDTPALAKEYGTPLYLFDGDRIRYNCRLYKKAMQSAFGPGSHPHYASKAACFKHICRVMKEEAMGLDLVSSGEIATALAAGFDLSNSLFHSNNKTDADLSYALQNGIGLVVVDGFDELEAVEAEAARQNITQNILLRLTPGIDPHTYEEVTTGKVDSKFGVAIETGQAEEFVVKAFSCSHIHVSGFHCHVGSQVFDEDGNVYIDAARVMLTFIRDMALRHAFRTEILDLGGGYGVRYVDSDPSVDIAACIASLGKAMKAICEELSVDLPIILMEPGRSIVADAGLTLYTAGTLKEITGYKNYLSIDGGMTDNPRYALYSSRYTVFMANRMNDPCDFTCDLVGRCCESGDIIQPSVTLPKPLRGDIVAVSTTGAYNYSMASNYNRLPRPPIVWLEKGVSKAVVRRETFEDLLTCDL